MQKRMNVFNKIGYYLVFIGIIIGLYFTSFVNYLFFHSIAELFSIIIAISIFIIGWNTRENATNSFFEILGIAFLFVSIFDTLHVFTYQGMNILVETGANISTQFWISGRYVQSISFLFATFYLKKKINIRYLFTIYVILTIFIILSIFVWQIFPICYIIGVGLTPFKKISEYIIILIFGFSLYRIIKNKALFSGSVYKNIALSLIFAMFSEFAFDQYLSVYGLPNLIGHILKILVFYLLYKAIVETGLKKPVDLLFTKLTQTEAELRNNLNFLETLINTIPSPVFYKDMKKELLGCNEQFSEKIAGIPKEEIIGTSPYIIPRESITQFDPENPDVNLLDPTFIPKNKNIKQYEAVVKCADDKERDYIFREAYYTDIHGNIKGKVGVMSDISYHKLLERKLEEEAKALERSNAELEEFAYVASHDLQEPLRKVTQFLGLLKERSKDKLEKDDFEFIEIAVNGARRMKQLINDLLDYSKLDKGEQIYEFCSLEEIIKEVLDNLSMLIEENNVKITKNLFPTLKVNLAQIRRVFDNLIRNAIKFHTTEPPEIQLSAKKEGDFWLFSVKDNGIGFDMKYSDRIFKKFQRLHTREEYAGTGIGLPICKKIIEQHGGSIWAESKPGEGATFYFTLPINRIKENNQD